jgi:hypothetical protein
MARWAGRFRSLTQRRIAESAMSLIVGQVRRANRKKSPRKLEPHEVIAKLKARSPATPSPRRSP